MTNQVPSRRVSPQVRRELLNQLADVEGMSIDAMLHEASTDSVAKAICVTPECGYAQEMEPDQDRGWCPECEDGTIQSCLILAGII